MCLNHPFSQKGQSPLWSLRPAACLSFHWSVQMLWSHVMEFVAFQGNIMHRLLALTLDLKKKKKFLSVLKKTIQLTVILLLDLGDTVRSKVPQRSGYRTGGSSGGLNENTDGMCDDSTTGPCMYEFLTNSNHFMRNSKRFCAEKKCFLSFNDPVSTAIRHKHKT